MVVGLVFFSPALVLSFHLSFADSLYSIFAYCITFLVFNYVKSYRAIEFGNGRGCNFGAFAFATYILRIVAVEVVAMGDGVRQHRVSCP